MDNASNTQCNTTRCGCSSIDVPMALLMRVLAELSEARQTPNLVQFNIQSLKSTWIYTLILTILELLFPLNLIAGTPWRDLAFKLAHARNTARMAEQNIHLGY